MKTMFWRALAIVCMLLLPGCAAHKPAKSGLIVPPRCVHLACREQDKCWCDPESGRCYNAHSEFSCTEVRKP